MCRRSRLRTIKIRFVVTTFIGLIIIIISGYRFPHIIVKTRTRLLWRYERTRLPVWRYTYYYSNKYTVVLMTTWNFSIVCSYTTIIRSKQINDITDTKDRITWSRHVLQLLKLSLFFFFNFNCMYFLLEWRPVNLNVLKFKKKPFTSIPIGYWYYFNARTEFFLKKKETKMKLLINLVKYLVYHVEWILIGVFWKRKKLPLYLSDNRDGGVKTFVSRAQRLLKYMWTTNRFRPTTVHASHAKPSGHQSGKRESTTIVN